jgi:hypothetical protein
MKFSLSIITLLLSTSLWAEVCSLHEVKGKVQINKDHFVLVLAEETLSEIKLKVPFQIQGKLAPYIDNTIQANIIVNGNELSKLSSLKSVSEVQRAVPDPLNAGGPTTRKARGKIKCP